MSKRGVRKRDEREGNDRTWQPTPPPLPPPLPSVTVSEHNDKHSQSKNRDRLSEAKRGANKRTSDFHRSKRSSVMTLSSKHCSDDSKSSRWQWTEDE